MTALLLWLVAGASGDALAANALPELELRVACEAPELPGRVRCEIELRAPEAARLAWSDVLVVSTPKGARPLRSRVAGSVGKDGVGRAALALVTTAPGVFPIVLRGRASVCGAGEEGARCRAVTRDARVEVRVGTP